MTKIALIPVARPTFDVAMAERFFAEAKDLLASLGAELVTPNELVMTPEQTEAVGVLDIDQPKIIYLNASFADASPAMNLLGKKHGEVLLWSVREFGEVGERLHLNSMCGSNLAAHALRTVGKSITHLHGNPDEENVKILLEKFLNGQSPDVGQPPLINGEKAPSEKVDSALAALKGSKIGAIGDAPNGFTPCQYDADLLDRYFGIEVVTRTIPDLFDAISQVPAEEAEEEYQSALQAQPSLGKVPAAEARTNASTREVLGDWIAENDLDAIAMRCWPEFPTELGACPCGAMGRTATSGTPAACERDVYGAATMLILEALGSGTNYLVDTVDLVEEEGLIRIWHCGSASTELAADPENATQWIHCNRKLGVAGNFALKPGPVVLVRLDSDSDPANTSKLRLVMTSGESLATPNRFQGNTATVRTNAPARQLINGLISNGYPHHTVVSWRDIRPEVRTLAERLGIPLMEW
jgi:L-fucose isomerase, C-terminal domain